MADDIVTRLHEMLDGPVPMAVTRRDVRDAADEIERLRVENERLRAAGDALAHLMPHAHLSVPCRPPQGTPLDEWCSECAALAAWKKARRG